MPKANQSASTPTRSHERSEILTCGDAVEMWKRFKLGESPSRIAAGFRLSLRCVEDVLDGRRFPKAKRLARI